MHRINLVEKKRTCVMSRGWFETTETQMPLFFQIKNKADNIHRNLAQNSLKKHRQWTFSPLQPSGMSPYQILGGKTVKNVQIDSQTTAIWLEKINVTSWLSDIYLITEKLSFQKIRRGILLHIFIRYITWVAQQIILQC